VECENLAGFYAKVIEELLAVFAGKRIGPWGGAPMAPP
jgi:hypothetical protein